LPILKNSPCPHTSPESFRKLVIAEENKQEDPENGRLKMKAYLHSSMEIFDRRILILQ
jgi:hypothetical protein